MDTISLILDWVAIGVVVICSILVITKCVWNFGLPYAMLLTKEKRAWSTFPLVELIPLLLALAVSWLKGLNGWMSVGTLAKFGFGLVLLSYLHFCVVSTVVGLLHRRKKSRANTE